MSREKAAGQGRGGTACPVRRAQAASAPWTSDPSKADFQLSSTWRRACSSSLSLPVRIPLPSSVMLPKPGPWWVPSVSAPRSIRRDTETCYLEQRLRGGREKSPHFSSRLHLNGLWAPQATSSSQAVASAQPMLRCQCQRHLSVHPHLASLFVPVWQLSVEIRLRWWKRRR